MENCGNYLPISIEVSIVFSLTIELTFRGHAYINNELPFVNYNQINTTV